MSKSVRLAHFDRQFNGGLSIKPADGVRFYEDGKLAKAIPVTLRILLSSALLLSPLWC